MKLDTSTDSQVGFRPPGNLDADTALEPYRGRFGRRQAAHLLRRAAFGGAPQEVDTLVALGMEGSVLSFLHPTAPDLDFPDYPDQDLLFDRKEAARAAQMWWLDRMLRTKHPLIEKMTLFWHGHFATSIRKVPAELMVEQIDLLRMRGLGNFRALLLSVSTNPAMLIWLDNRSNYKAHPNENYAREVMELFALGLGNYTENDVKNAARAFTGWTINKEKRFVFRPGRHDDGVKHFLGRTGAFDGTNVLDIILEQPIHSRFMCRKILEFFVYSDPEPELVEKLSSVYTLGGYDVAKVIGSVLRSNVFYSQRAYRAMPKSPIEFTIGLYRYLGVQSIPPDAIGWLRRMGQEPLAPPSVKGWDGGPTWINTSTLLARFNLVNKMVKARDCALTPDVLIAQAGDVDADKILDVILAGSLQNDLTNDIRATLAKYINTGDPSLPVPLSGENYQERIRGVLSLALNLPSNQLN
jgi:uncharacterized protein (DUF1800 family)